LIFRRLYNEALRIVNSVALQYFTCDENVSDLGSNLGGHARGDASNLLKAMQDQERLSFVRQDSFLSQCSEDPWFVEHFTDVSPMKLNVTTSQQRLRQAEAAAASAAASDSLGRSKKELLLRLPHKLRPEKPLVDSKVRF
jgi:hypothetical protein